MQGHFQTGFCRRCHHRVKSGGNVHKDCPPHKKTPAEIAALDAVAARIPLVKVTEVGSYKPAISKKVKVPVYRW